MDLTNIEHQDFSGQSLSGKEFECVHFIGCRFMAADLSGAIFTECLFEQCDLGNAKLSRSSFRETHFQDCKMIGLRFEDCQPFIQPPAFTGCDLSLTSWVGLKLPAIHFCRCTLREADFSGTTLEKAVFDQADLSGAIFEGTNLTGADLRYAFHYQIDPEKNRLRQARFSLDGLPGLLVRYQIKVE